MSEMVEIKAEALKWCGNGFEYIADGCLCSHSHFVDDGKSDLIHEKTGVVVSGIETVLVNAKDYEKAVIERIKEMVVGLTSIDKSNGKIEVHDRLQYFEALADPRPWEDEYTIEIGE